MSSDKIAITGGAVLNSANPAAARQRFLIGVLGFSGDIKGLDRALGPQKAPFLLA